MKIILTLAFFLSVASAFGACVTDKPENTLKCYFGYLETVESDKVLEIYYGIKSFYIPSEGIKHEYYKVLSNETLKSDIVFEDVGSPIWAKAGNVHLTVEKKSEGRIETASYFFRRIDNSWLIVGHNVHGYAVPDEDA